jgi:hypothetical protein
MSFKRICAFSLMGPLQVSRTRMYRTERTQLPTSSAEHPLAGCQLCSECIFPIEGIRNYNAGVNAASFCLRDTHVAVTESCARSQRRNHLLLKIWALQRGLQLSLVKLHLRNAFQKLLTTRDEGPRQHRLLECERHRTARESWRACFAM